MVRGPEAPTLTFSCFLVLWSPLSWSTACVGHLVPSEIVSSLSESHVRLKLHLLRPTTPKYTCSRCPTNLNIFQSNLSSRTSNDSQQFQAQFNQVSKYLPTRCNTPQHDIHAMYAPDLQLPNPPLLQENGLRGLPQVGKQNTWPNWQILTVCQNQ